MQSQHWSLTQSVFVRGRTRGGLGLEKWNDTLHGGLWRAAILSPDQSPWWESCPLAALSFWKVWLCPCVCDLRGNPYFGWYADSWFDSGFNPLWITQMFIFGSCDLRTSSRHHSFVLLTKMTNSNCILPALFALIMKGRQICGQRRDEPNARERNETRKWVS